VSRRTRGVRGVWLLIIGSVSALACARPHARTQAAPPPESLVTVGELRRRLLTDSVRLLVVDGIPLDLTLLDSLPVAEVVSANFVTSDHCHMWRAGGCRVLVVERCSEDTGRKRRSAPRCPWVVARPE